MGVGSVVKREILDEMFGMWKDLPEGHTLRNISDIMFQERDDPT